MAVTFLISITDLLVRIALEERADIALRRNIGQLLALHDGGLLVGTLHRCLLLSSRNSYNS